MASTSQVMILVDDTAMQYAGANIWGPSPSAHWVGGNSSFAAGTANAGPFGAFNFTFQGTSVVFYGNTSPSDKAQTFTVAIDGDPPHPAAYPAPQQYRQWYASPPLSDATHTVSLDNMVFIDLDYAVVTAGPSTPLKGTTIIVDDNSPELIYSGKWIQNTNLFETGHGYAPGLPFQNAAHQSTTIGDSFTFQFAGTSIEVHGVFQWAVPGSVDATFVLDGTSTSLSFPPTPTKPLFDDQPNFMFFSASNLAAGNHTLAMNVTNVEGAQGFMFDYILYSPSFDSLALKPNFAATADPPSSKRAIPVALILACIVAGLVVICLVILYLFLRRRRASRPSSNDLSSQKIDAFVSLRQSSSTSPEIPVSLSTAGERPSKHGGHTFLTLGPPLQPHSRSASQLSYNGPYSARAHYIRDLNDLLAQLEAQQQESSTEAQIAALQHRINLLRAENARVIPPPAYNDDSRIESTLEPAV